MVNKKTPYDIEYWVDRNYTIENAIIEINKLKEIAKIKMYSCWKIDHWLAKGLTHEEAKLKVSELQLANFNKRKLKYNNNFKGQTWFSIDYYLKQDYSYDEAKQMQFEAQSNLSKRSKKFSGKHHTDESKLKIGISSRATIAKIGSDVWLKHFKYGDGRSQTEIELYKYIVENIDNNVECNKKVGVKIVDIIKNNLIIEFYGDYWHANPKIYKENDILFKFSLKHSKTAAEIWTKNQKRIDYLNELGYKVLIIWEYDWNNKKEEVINKIKNFLNDTNNACGN